MGVRKLVHFCSMDYRDSQKVWKVGLDFSKLYVHIFFPLTYVIICVEFYGQRKWVETKLVGQSPLLLFRAIYLKNVFP